MTGQRRPLVVAREPSRRLSGYVRAYAAQIIGRMDFDPAIRAYYDRGEEAARLPRRDR